jgi:hypothetical protein
MGVLKLLVFQEGIEPKEGSGGKFKVPPVQEFRFRSGCSEPRVLKEVDIWQLPDSTDVRFLPRAQYCLF